MMPQAGIVFHYSLQRLVGVRHVSLAQYEQANPLAFPASRIRAVDCCQIRLVTRAFGFHPLIFCFLSLRNRLAFLIMNYILFSSA